MTLPAVKPDFLLVYQNGHASVIRRYPSIDPSEDPNEPSFSYALVHQETFRSSEDVCKGILLTNHSVFVFHWDGYGNVLENRDKWRDGSGGTFKTSQQPPKGCIDPSRDDKIRYRRRNF